MTPKSNEKGVKNTDQVKSPSDTTLYTPALRKQVIQGSNLIVDKISQFVENVRPESSEASASGRV